MAKHEALQINAALSAVVTDLIRAGLRSGAHGAAQPVAAIGRLTLLPPRDEINTPAHVRTLIGQEGIKR